MAHSAKAQGQDETVMRLSSGPGAAARSAYPAAEPGTACSAAWKPTFECVPSQNGFLVDAPQRHGRPLGGVDVPVRVPPLDRAADEVRPVLPDGDGHARHPAPPVPEGGRPASAASCSAVRLRRCAATCSAVP